MGIFWASRLRKKGAASRFPHSTGIENTGDKPCATSFPRIIFAFLRFCFLLLRGLSCSVLPTIARSLTAATKRRLAYGPSAAKEAGMACRAPRTQSLGIGGAGVGAQASPILSPEAACGGSPTAESSARLSREAVALVRRGFFPVVALIVRGVSSGAWKFWGRWSSSIQGKAPFHATVGAPCSVRCWVLGEECKRRHERRRGKLTLKSC